MKKYDVSTNHPDASCSVTVTFTAAELSEMYDFLCTVGARKASYTTKIDATLDSWQPPSTSLFAKKEENPVTVEQLITLYYCPACENHYVNDAHLNTEGISCTKQHPTTECCHAGDIKVLGSLVCELRAQLLEPA